MTTPAEVVSRLAAEDIQFVDMRFTDVPGTQHHYTLPVHQLTEEVFTEGLGFDGSSITGFQSIDQSDMLLLPDADTGFVDPFFKHKTLALICNVYDPVTGFEYFKDPRVVAKRAVRYLQGTGVADTCYVGPEAEFFIFDGVNYHNEPYGAAFEVRSVEGIWTSGDTLDARDDPNLGHRIRYKSGYFPLPPLDRHQDLRAEMVATLEACGVEVELHHHEVGTAGQAEIDMRFDHLLTMADKVQLYKYVCKNVAARAQKTVTFMPKPIYGDNGSGMHVHMSLWKDGETLFYDRDNYAGLSEMARHFTGGVLAHAPAILVFAATTVNSYKRLVPGYEAPVNLVYSERNRSAAIRVPLVSESPAAKRIEFRCPDPSANPYLAFAAILLAGLDGVLNGIEPPDPLDKDIYSLSAEELAGVATVPASLGRALDALEEDHDFLRVGGVFGESLLESYIEAKREEIDTVALRPHPMEFELYYSI